MTTPQIDIDSIPADQLRTRLKVALEDAAAKGERVIELEVQVRNLEDTLDGIDAAKGLSGGALDPALQDTALVARDAAGGELAAPGGAFAEPPPGLQELAAFIGLAPHYGTSTTALMNGLRALRDGGAAGEEGSGTDTLAESIEHNRTERINLGRDLRQSRQVVNQVAAALQVGQWDKDGTEIIERGQRLGIINHALRRRLKAVEDLKVITPHDQGEAAERAARRKGASDELRGLMAEIMAPEALAKFLASKPSFAPTPAMFEAITAPAPVEVPFLDSFTIDQLHWIIALADLADARLPDAAACRRLLLLLARSETAMSDVVAMFRGALLPILRTQVGKGIIRADDLISP